MAANKSLAKWGVFILRCLVVKNLLVSWFDCWVLCLSMLCMFLYSSVSNLFELQDSEIQSSQKDNHKVKVSFTEAKKVHSKYNSNVAEARDELFPTLRLVSFSLSQSELVSVWSESHSSSALAEAIFQNDQEKSFWLITKKISH